METPEIRLNEVQTFEAGEVSSKIVTSQEVVPNDLSELLRKLQNAADIVGSALPNALPGDQALLVGLSVQICAVADLFAHSAEAVGDASTDTLPLAEED